MSGIDPASLNRITGLASGLDVDTIITNLMKAARAPLDSMKQTRQIWEWKQEDYRSINTTLRDFRDTAFNLKLQGTFAVKETSSSDESIVTATAGATAAPTSYQVKVGQLATIATNASASKISGSAAIDPSATLWSQKDNFLSGNFGWTEEDHHFTFTINGQSFTFNGDTDSLNTVIATVNQNSAAGVSMFYDPGTDKVAISTVKTGDNNPGAAEIQVSGGFMTDVLQISEANEQGGTDAVYQINGLSGMTSHANTFTLNGVTFNLKGVTTGGLSGAATTVTVAYDVDSVVNSIKDFINKYNDTIAVINNKLNEQRYSDYKPLTDDQIQDGNYTDKQIDDYTAKARSGLLQGDSLLTMAVTGMRRAITGIVRGVTGQVTVTSGSQTITTTANSLATIGITTGSWQENGKLYLDEDRLREALQSNPEAVMDLFTRTRDASGASLTAENQKGLAVQLYDAVNNAMSQISSQAGSIDNLYDNSYISRTIRDIDRRITDKEEQLQDLQDRYYRQFTAMEQAITLLNAQGSWLALQFGTSGQ